MDAIIIIIVFLGLLFIGMPIAFDLGIVALIGIYLLDIPLITVAQKMFTGLNSFTLLAVPLFILAASLMNKGKISEQLIEVAKKLVGHLRGGLAQANVVVSMIFAGISGSAQADTAGIGKILIPQMIKSGYSPVHSVGVTTASSTIGIIIPPSIQMVVYGSIASVSVGALFLAGIIPGILIGLSQMIYVYFLAKKYDYPRDKRASLKEIVVLFIKYFPSLLTPVIIIGGVVGGIVTPTEASAIACIYAIILGCLVFKTIKLRELPEIFAETLKMTSQSLFALAAATAFGELLSYYGVSEIIGQFFIANSFSPSVFLLMIVALYLFLGTFMDAIPAMTLFVPVFLPIAATLGIEPAHLGIVTVMTLAIGLVTPPYGLCLLIAGGIGELKMVESFKAIKPYIILMLVVLLFVLLFPNVIMFIPKLIRPEWF